jgi:endonuclease/exonuclease/phosphatase family metal-dependent hydrolase
MDMATAPPIPIGAGSAEILSKDMANGRGISLSLRGSGRCGMSVRDVIIHPLLVCQMLATENSRTGPPEILDHSLNRYFPDLLQFDSTPEMEASELYRKIKPDVERIMTAVVVSGPATAHDGRGRITESSSHTNIHALAWNLERGIRLDGILKTLSSDEQFANKDVLLLTELDHGMARSGNRFVAREIADALGINYAFAPLYIPLQKGSGVEAAMEGENTLSIHGLGMFSPHPMKNIHAVPLPNGKDKMWGKEKRLGWLRALVADIDHPGGPFRAVTVHLDVHCSREHRRRQMQIVLDHLDTLEPLPTLIGGDWNTTTYNAQNATRAILGYWRRVMMGIRNVAYNHFPHPDRYFERALFAELTGRGYEYQSLNEAGAGTLHYEVASIEKNTNLRDWVPEWCFPFIFWAAGRVGGRVSVRLDWFAANGLKLAAGSRPQTLGSLVDDEGRPLSDHDAIAVDLARE